MARALLPLLAALAAFALLADPAAAQTCSCTKYESSRQFVGFSDVIFKGKALSSKTKYGSTAPAQVAVTHPAPGKSCGGVAFAAGQVVVVVAQGMVEDLATTGCQTTAYSEAQIRAALH